MNNQNNQIITTSEAVIHFPEGGTCLVNDLLEELIDDQKNLTTQLNVLYLKLKAEGASVYQFRDELKAFIEDNPVTENEEVTITKIFEDGIDCNLLQPGSKGWQKGKLTMCFQFMPEGSDSTSTEEKSTKSSHSPLDEIRQLANSLPTDQN